jgi:hypothetical protein
MTDQAMTFSNELARMNPPHTLPTSSRKGTLYFAYGSNLSHSQMAVRCNKSPGSCVPVAVARLDQYTWFICERGYANVRRLSPGEFQSKALSEVWGILYNLQPADEQQLDLYEGHNMERNPSPQINPDPQTQFEKPYLQGAWDYNKHYLRVSVVKWLQDPTAYGVNVPNWTMDTYHATYQGTVRALVYVDELRTEPGQINQEYIGRMNRGIRESVARGLDHDWVREVMRPVIPADIEVDHPDYVGAPEGYVAPDQPTSTRKVRVKPPDDAPRSGN